MKNNYQIQLQKQDALTTAYRKVVNKKGEAVGEFSENKIANKIVKSKSMSDENSRDVILLEKSEEMLSELRQVL